MSGGEKMQTHAHTIRVWLESVVVCVPLSAFWEGKVGEGVFVEEAETE